MRETEEDEDWCVRERCDWCFLRGVKDAETEKKRDAVDGDRWRKKGC